MSVQALSAVLSFDVGDSTRKLVLIGLANHAHDDGTAAYAGVEKLAKYANCSARTVQRHVTKLLEDGFLREGDQSVIDPRIPARFRPIAYEVALSEAIAATWADERSDSGRRQTFAGHGKRGGTASAQVKRGDNLTPLTAGPASSASEHPSATAASEPSTGFRGDKLSPLNPVDNHASGVTPVTVRGDTCDASGVTPVSPKPSNKPPTETNSYVTSGRDVAAVDNSRARSRSASGPAPSPDSEQALAAATKALIAIDEDEVERTLLHLPDRLRPTSRDALRLRGLIVQRMQRGWTRQAILSVVNKRLRDGGTLDNPCGLFAAVLVPLSESPMADPFIESHVQPARTPQVTHAPWCGHCDEKTRFLLDHSGFPDNAGPRCPECKQLAFTHHMERGAS